MLHVASKTRNRIVVLWLITFCFLYYIFFTTDDLNEYQSLLDQMHGNKAADALSVLQENLSNNSNVPSSTVNNLSKLSHIPVSSLAHIDAVVYISMGQMSRQSLLDFSVHSLRQQGAYTGDVYVVTDSPACFVQLRQTESEHKLHFISVPPLSSIIKVKALKTQLLSLLPASKKSILYLDVDILVTKPLYSFVQDLQSSLYSQIVMKQRQASRGQLLPSPNKMKSLQAQQAVYNSTATSFAYSLFDIGAFYDAAGHYVGLCSGCDKWHTGVLWFLRKQGDPSSAGSRVSEEAATASSDKSDAGKGVSDASENRPECLTAWESILLSGRFDTDQESLDEAERLGFCSSVLPFPSTHLLFAKDYLGWIFTSSQTFVHVTAAGRLQDQVSRYRYVMHGYSIVDNFNVSNILFYVYYDLI